MPSRIRLCALLALGVLTALPLRAQAPAGAGDLERHLAPYRNATFVLLDPATGETMRVHPERAAERVSPASTFKIPHALAALDAGVLDGPGHVVRWDSTVAPARPWWPESWRRDHTLRSAVENSVVWYFQEVARQMGEEREQAYLDAFDYGNRDLSGGLTRFWLGTSLGISADEQVRFWRRLWEGGLPASAAAQATVRDLVPVLREGEGFRLLGKTGTALLDGTMDGPMLSWLAGVAEVEGRPHVFALHVEADGWVRPKERVALAEALLRDAGVLPAGPD
ncbi:MAG: penicillin-binding transpeptidase domain-containing protein [Rhodothermales bacterium]|nr:penicillin-binding transpeptidase domain-containing protein [Rhodothermales bacterium]